MFATPTQPTVAACTIVAHNYLPLARVLARSFLKWHPEASFSVVVVDHPIETRTLGDEGFRVIPITEIDFGDEGFEFMATAYDVTEFATSMKPFALQHLLRDADCAFYIDPDIVLYERLDELVELTLSAGITLTPHCLLPIEMDDAEPSQAAIMGAGVYNLGYIGVARAASDFLAWWAARLRRWALIDPAEQLFTDQRWIDLAVPVFSPHIVRNPAYNVAYWNLDQRVLTREGERYFVNGEPLRLFHFSGYDPKAPHWISKYQLDAPRVLMSSQPVLAELCAEYEVALEECRVDDAPKLPYGWREAFPGLVLCKEIRRMFHRELVLSDKGKGPQPPTPFLPGGAQRFRDWLNEVAPNSVAPAPRSIMSIWEGRADLRAAAPDVARGEVAGLRHWFDHAGRYEYAHVRLLDWPADPTAADADTDRAHGDGVEVIGYLRAELGVGQAGRLASLALSSVGIPVATAVSSRTTSRQQHELAEHMVGPQRTALIAVNADQLRQVRADLGPGYLDRRYTIGQWFWETEDFPEQLGSSFELVDELWSATDFMREVFAAAAPDHVEVLHMPLPLRAPAVDPTASRATFGLPDGYLFLFCFDMFSIVERKNPFGVIDAFCAAFEPGEGPILVIKSINGDARLRALEELRWHCRGRRDIIVIDGYLTSAQSGALMALADCYVSLHRAEGLGLTMAEAMCLGKPVIATAYSGNMDFMTPTTAFLVPWEPVDIGPGHQPYDPASRWADPDLARASALMRQMVDDPDAGAAVGLAAQQDLTLRFSPAVCGARMQQRLTKIWSSRE